MRALRDSEEAVRLFEQFGGTDFEYLRPLLPLPCDARRVADRWSPDIGPRVLDVGAHWLHQAALFRSAGFEVTAVDLPSTFETQWVQAAGREVQITLCPVQSLAAPSELSTVPDSSFDLLLSEIIEHITFNPVGFWKEAYRLLRPGGRIVITTPNYYSPYSRVWDLRRFLYRRNGSGNNSATLA
jgi:2-polyprenyl-3-methyl-5-hydroxy-6-metoxy-1,4-benzoquinol methylase